MDEHIEREIEELRELSRKAARDASVFLWSGLLISAGLSWYFSEVLTLPEKAGLGGATFGPLLILSMLSSMRADAFRAEMRQIHRLYTPREY